MSDLNQEQVTAIEELGYSVNGNTVMDTNKNIVMDKPDRDSDFETEVEELKNILSGSNLKKAKVTEAEAVRVRARNSKGQLMGDDPSTPDVNEAWVIKS